MYLRHNVFKENQIFIAVLLTVMKLMTRKKKTIPIFPGVLFCAYQMFLFCVLCCIFLIQKQKCKVMLQVNI